MAFNIKKPADLATLKAEINTDPAGMGYSAVRGETKKTLDKLNFASNNVGTDSINRPTEEIDIPDIAGVIDPVEFAALSEYDKEWVKMFINQPFDAALKPFQAKFLAIFKAGTKTRAAAMGLRSKPASRAEVLFGVNTVLTREDYFAARDS